MFKLVSEQPFGSDRQIQKYVLEVNGLTVLLLPDPTTPVIAYHTWMKVGSRHEKHGRTGMAHLFEHLMFKATSTFGEGEFDRIMESKGAQTNAATFVDWTYYYEVLPASHENLEMAVQMESDRMVNLILNHDQLESERQVVINERRYRVDDDPDGTLYEKLYDLALAGNPYGWPTIGWMQDIESISLEDCLDFYRTYYAPNNAVIVISGQFKSQDALDLIGKYYGGIPSQMVPAEIVPDAPVIDENRRLELDLSVTTPRLLMGWICPGSQVFNLDNAALDLGIEILFGGESSRFYRLLVLEKEMTSSIDAWASNFRYPGLVEISASLKPDVSVAEVESLILAELAKIADEPPTADELTKALNQFESGLYRSLTTANAKAGKLGHYEVTCDDYRRFRTGFESLKQVTCEDIQRVIGDVFSAPRATVVARPAGGE